MHALTEFSELAQNLAYSISLKHYVDAVYCLALALPLNCRVVQIIAAKEGLSLQHVLALSIIYALFVISEKLLSPQLLGV